jgi:hypothetical protein
MSERLFGALPNQVIEKDKPLRRASWPPLMTPDGDRTPRRRQGPSGRPPRRDLECRRIGRSTQTPTNVLARRLGVAAAGELDL